MFAPIISVEDSFGLHYDAIWQHPVRGIVVVGCRDDVGQLVLFVGCRYSCITELFPYFILEATAILRGFAVKTASSVKVFQGLKFLSVKRSIANSFIFSYRVAIFFTEAVSLCRGAAWFFVFDDLDGI